MVFFLIIYNIVTELIKGWRKKIIIWIKIIRILKEKGTFRWIIKSINGRENEKISWKRIKNLINISKKWNDVRIIKIGIITQIR